MSKHVVVVESPAKAKTIQKYLGKDFEILASFGHVRDLETKNMGIDVEHNFLPKYEVIKGKEGFLKQLKQAEKQKKTIWLATDPDREGEAISWHIVEGAQLDHKRVKRVVFVEITKTAVTKAIEQARSIDVPLVNAQQARRVLDRLVGFELSPVLWRKVRKGLSAGRVQSVAVRLVVEKEQEIQAFEASNYFNLKAELKTASGEVFEASCKEKLQSKQDVLDYLNSLASLSSVNIDECVQKDAFRNPQAPFTTSSLQQEASRRLGFSVTQTMRLAQSLYEAGHITYMRTDSVHLAQEAIDQAKKFIVATFGPDYSNSKQYQSKSKGAQEAHEAIRPSQFNVESVDIGSAENKLYQLIRNRSLSSQMAAAKLAKTEASLQIGKYAFVAKGEVITFKGFLALDALALSKDQLLPTLVKGDEVTLESLDIKEKVTRHPARFTEASLVRKLEELGIGRPSTYAPTISTIQKREYVLKKDLEGVKKQLSHFVFKQGSFTENLVEESVGSDSGKLMPTDIGQLVTEFLTTNFSSVLNYDFTAKIEEDFDAIAKNELSWQNMIEAFYASFHQKVERVQEEADRVSGERFLGQDEDGEKIIVRMGRYGPLVQKGEATDTHKPRYASLLSSQSIQTITLEEALELFKFPRELGEYLEQKVLVNQGPYGPYIKWDTLNVSIKDQDPLQVLLDTAIELIKEKQEFEKNRLIKTFDQEKPIIEILNGRFGPYVQQGKNRAKIPKDTDPKTLDLETSKQLLSAPKASRSKKKVTRGGQKKT